uniref:Asp_protease_2 domain-containing protein n=1 Tax=Cajanus cajan TaxID=3821 RepID=A0A151QME7_CAJCA|nr:hypothetical protein KK1_048214 [Cajanus cajan]
MIRKLLNNQPSGTLSQRENNFHTRCNVSNKVCSLIVDSGSWCNYCSTRLVKKLCLTTMLHPKPYQLHWLNEDGDIIVNQQVRVKFSIGKYEEEVLCNVVPMEACHILLGRPWKFDKKIMHNSLTNEITFTHKEKKFFLHPLSPQQVANDQAQMKLKREEEKERKKSFRLGKSKEENVSSKGLVRKEDCFITKNHLKNILFIHKNLISYPYFATSHEMEIQKQVLFKEKESQLQDLVKKKWTSLSPTSCATSLVVTKVDSLPFFRTHSTLVVLIKHQIFGLYCLIDTTYSVLYSKFDFKGSFDEVLLEETSRNALQFFSDPWKKCKV